MVIMITMLAAFIFGLCIGAIYQIRMLIKWEPWKDVSIVYEGYTYYLLQMRVNTNGRRQFRQTLIVKNANLPPEDKQAIMDICGTLNDKLNIK